MNVKSITTVTNEENTLNVSRTTICCRRQEKPRNITRHTNKATRNL